MKAKDALPDRLWNRLDRSGDCWLWTGAKNSNGYGQIGWNRRVAYVHRVVYEWANGPIGDGLEIDHLCHVRLCANPDHLEVVDRATNAQRRRDCKLTAADVAEIRLLRAKGRSNAEISARYGIAKAHVSHVNSGVRWKSIA